MTALALEPGENVLAAAQTDRLVRLMTHALVAVVAVPLMTLGAKLVLVQDRAAALQGFDGRMMLTLVFLFGPILAAPMMEARERVFVTSRRVVVLRADGSTPDMALADIVRVRRFFGAITLLSKRQVLRLPSLREAVAIERLIRSRMAT